VTAARVAVARDVITARAIDRRRDRGAVAARDRGRRASRRASRRRARDRTFPK